MSKNAGPPGTSRLDVPGSDAALADRIEHFVYGSAATLRRLIAELPADLEVRKVKGGLVLRETLAAGADPDAERSRVEALALAHGAEYDGFGRPLVEDANEGGLDLQRQPFAARTGIAAGYGLALPLPDGRFGHGVFLGDNPQGYMLLEISALVSDQPATVEVVSRSPRRYRQPILVWHTGFTVRPLTGAAAPIVQLPYEVVLRDGIGWPDPETVARLEHAFAIEAAGTAEGWDMLLLAMAEAGRRLPGVEGCSLWSAHVDRKGTLKLIEDHTPVEFEDRGRAPMPWHPSTIDELTRALGGGPDIIAARDRVT